MKFIRTTLDSLLLVQDTVEKIALAFSVGVFLGFSPFIGLHTILGFITAAIFRLNKTAVLIGLFINNPWVLVPYYTFSTWFGIQLVGLPSGVSLAEIGLRDMLDLEFWYWIASQWKLAIPAFIGSFFISIVLAVLAYVVALFLIRKALSKN